MLEELKVGKVIIGKQGENSEQYQKFSNIVQKKDITVVVMKMGNIINIEKGVRIKILFPDDKLIDENVLNNNSIVAMLEYKEIDMLLTGDIEKIAEQKLLKIYSSNELKADILKLPHHRFKNFKFRGIFKSGFSYNCFNRSWKK